MYLVLSNINLIDLKNECAKKGMLILKDGKIEKTYYGKGPKLVGFPAIDLKGNFLMPGFTDSHTHLLSFGIERQRIDLGDCHSLSECLEKLSAGESEKIIFGVNWDESKWQKEKIEDLNRDLLDKISKKKAVIMRRICGHFAVANTKALKFIPHHWRIVDRKKGFLYEDAALYLNRIFRPSIKMYKRGLEIAINEALSRGITTINEITDEYGFKVYKRFKNGLKLRVAIYLVEDIDWVIAHGLKTNMGDEFLKFSGIKIFMDGSIGARTAALKIPYTRTKNYGKLLIFKSRLVQIIKRAEANSLQLMIHSIGDHAIDVVLDAFEEAGIKKNLLRHRLEHIEILSKKQIEKIAKLGLIASVQPNFIAWQFPDGLYEKNLGLRYKNLNRFKSLLDANVEVIFGSDCMPMGPLKGIGFSLNHPHPKERLSIAQSLRLYTEAPQIATFDEKIKGKIEPGNFADFVVFNKNPLKKENLKGLKVLMVFVNGKVVYRGVN